jgi:hypothetical protein
MRVLATLAFAGAVGAVADRKLVTQPCNPSDPNQLFAFDDTTGQLSAQLEDGAKWCAVVSGCSPLVADAAAVLTPCASAKSSCAAWSMQKPPHTESAQATWLVAPGSPSGEPRCLETPKKNVAGAVDVYCCSGESSSCGSVYPSALPWQQWQLQGRVGGKPGLVQSMVSGGLCLAAGKVPAPPLAAAPVWPLPKHLACTPAMASAPAMLSSSVVVKLVGSPSDTATAAIARYQPLLRSLGTAGGAVTVVKVTATGSVPLNRDTDYSYGVSYAPAAAASIVNASAASPFGVAYALETLLQLAEEENAQVRLSITQSDPTLTEVVCNRRAAAASKSQMRPTSPIAV